MYSATFQDLAASGALEYGDGYRTKAIQLGRPGIPILRVSDVADGHIAPVYGDYIRDEYRSAMRNKVSRPGDVVLTTKGTVGRVAMIPEGMEEFSYSPQLCYFRVSQSSRLLARYLYYWLRSPAFRDQASAVKGQTDMADYLNLADLGAIRISLPSVVLQGSIIAVLSALDGKIVANEDIVEASQRLADAHFITLSSMHPASVATFDDLADIFGGGTPSTAEASYWNGDVCWATPTDITRLSSPYLSATEKKITRAGLQSCASALHPSGSILMTSRATIGRFAVNEMPTATNQGFIVVRPRSVEQKWWLFHEMRSRVDAMVSLANGSTFLELSRKNFKQMSVRRPEHEVVRNFHDTVDPIHARASAAVRENQLLTNLRDALLPKLISGELRIKDAERVVSDAV